MSTAVCYHSSHHGNTLKVLEAMAAENQMDLIDVTTRQAVRLEAYDCIGFASGIYYGSFQKSVLQFARQYLPEGKPVFFVYTCGMLRPGYTRAIEQVAAEKNCPVLGAFGCPGYDTFGPFRLVGGIAKGHPDREDLENARRFSRSLQESAGGGTEP